MTRIKHASYSSVSNEKISNTLFHEGYGADTILIILNVIPVKTGNRRKCPFGKSASLKIMDHSTREDDKLKQNYMVKEPAKAKSLSTGFLRDKFLYK